MKGKHEMHAKFVSANLKRTSFGVVQNRCRPDYSLTFKNRASYI